MQAISKNRKATQQNSKITLKVYVQTGHLAIPRKIRVSNTAKL